MGLWCFFFLFFKQKTAYEMRISDWSSDVCSSDLSQRRNIARLRRIRMPADDAERAGGAHPNTVPSISLRAVRSMPASVGCPCSSTVTTHSVEIGRASCRERVCQYV